VQIIKKRRFIKWKVKEPVEKTLEWKEKKRKDLIKKKGLEWKKEEEEGLE